MVGKTGAPEEQAQGEHAAWSIFVSDNKVAVTEQLVWSFFTYIFMDKVQKIKLCQVSEKIRKPFTKI